MVEAPAREQAARELVLGRGLEDALGGVLDARGGTTSAGTPNSQGIESISLMKLNS